MELFFQLQSFPYELCLKRWQSYFCKIGNMSEFQSTLWSQQQYITMLRLQQWVENLVRKGRSKELGELLKTMPLIEKLSDAGLCFCFRCEEKFEVVEANDLGHAIAQHVKEVELESQQEQSQYSSEQQSEFYAYENGVMNELASLYDRLKGSMASVERLQNVAGGVKGYLQKTSQLLLSFLGNSKLKSIYINAISLYSTYTMNAFRSYIDFELTAIKGLNSTYERLKRRQEKSSSHVKKQESSQIKEKKERESSSRLNSEEIELGESKEKYEEKKKLFMVRRKPGQTRVIKNG